VPAAEVAGQQHDEQDDAADQAHGLRGERALLGLGGGLVDGGAGGHPDGRADGRGDRGEQHRSAGGGEPAEERGPELHAPELLLLPVRGLLAGLRHAVAGRVVAGVVGVVVGWWRAVVADPSRWLSLYCLRASRFVTTPSCASGSSEPERESRR
jgi:hypothetical protein